MIAIFKIEKDIEAEILRHWEKLKEYDVSVDLRVTPEATGYLTMTGNVFMVTEGQLFFAGRRGSLLGADVIPAEVLASLPQPWVYISSRPEMAWHERRLKLTDTGEFVGVGEEGWEQAVWHIVSERGYWAGEENWFQPVPDAEEKSYCI